NAPNQRTIENTLGLWVSSLITSEQVVEWATKEIMRLDQPPMELFDLVTYGPEQCLKRASSDFPPRPVHLSYVQAFSFAAVSLPLASDEAVFKFADWA